MTIVDWIGKPIYVSYRKTESKYGTNQSIIGTLRGVDTLFIEINELFIFEKMINNNQTEQWVQTTGTVFIPIHAITHISTEFQKGKSFK